MRTALWLSMCLLFSRSDALAASKSPKDAPQSAPKPSAIDEILTELKAHPARPGTSPGSTFDPGGRFADVSRDLRASHVNDLVTVIISDHASASSVGATTTARKSQANASISALAGIPHATGPLANLLGTTTNTQLAGQGLTNRTSDITTNLTARVIAVLPSGDLIVEGNKLIQINSEKQKVTLRGIARWNDITPSNQVSSDQLAELEVLIDGRGVVNDAVRRPNFLYRLLLGLLPF
ncbi:MAG: flagellar basal body L-ring protein FlgH [Terriglobales bacterium]